MKATNTPKVPTPWNLEAQTLNYPNLSKARPTENPCSSNHFHLPISMLWLAFREKHRCLTKECCRKVWVKRDLKARLSSITTAWNPQECCRALSSINHRFLTALLAKVQPDSHLSRAKRRRWKRRSDWIRVWSRREQFIVIIVTNAQSIREAVRLAKLSLEANKWPKVHHRWATKMRTTLICGLLAWAKQT